MINPKLIIHGGAGLVESPDFTEIQYDRALRRVLKTAYETLCKNSAREAVLHSVRLLEDNPLFNAGYGSRLQKDGRVRMSAAIMDSSTGKFSGVINICNVKNPINVADILSRKRHTVLSGRGATEFARRQKMEYVSPIAPHRLKEHRDRVRGDSGTVGVVALDRAGRICVGTSTGGIGYETPGRVSDSATVAGTYASEACGVSCTGRGEGIVNHAVASRIVARVEDGISLDAAIKITMRISHHQKLRFGLIALDSQGHMAVGNGYATKVLFAKCDGMKIETFYSKGK
jgi:L-asparaginase